MAMRLDYFLVSVVYVLSASVAFGQNAPQPAPANPAAAASKTTEADWQMLDRLQAAARLLNYTGTFVFQRGLSVHATRITHMSDGRDSFEKLEPLDGTAQEYIRLNDNVQCYTPSAKTVLIEKRGFEGTFPQLLSGTPDKVREQYQVRRGGTDRVAQLECEVVSLIPKDNLRYGYRLCVERAGGLLIKAQTLDEKQQVLEQVAFIDLKTGMPFDRKKLKPSVKFDKNAGWRIDEPHTEQLNLATSGLSLANLPAGFKKIFGVKRALGSQSNVRQIVVSDGLASISVFVEPASASGGVSEGVWGQGASNMVSRTRGEWRVTAVGETPTATLQKITDALEIKSP